MINLSNIKLHSDIPFNEYLKMPGYSHSFLKADKGGYAKEFTVTEKVTLGKIVDAILTDPANVNMLAPLYSTAKVIAASINDMFGNVLNMMQTQLSYTADLEYNGFIMPGKFRPDLVLPGKAVIDIKVTFEKDVRALIEYMGYNNQLWGYARVTDVPQQYILAQRCKKLTSDKIIPIGNPELIRLENTTMFNEFWADKITNFGTVAA